MRLKHKLSIWDSVYSSDAAYFGYEPSVLAKESLRFFDENQCKKILELGCGQGRDTIFLARNGLKIHAVDASAISVAQLKEKVAGLELDGDVKISLMDLPRQFPAIEQVDAVYSHLFYCMPFDDQGLKSLFDFTRKILHKNGLHVFSVRDKKADKSFGKGKEIGKDTFDINGFKVRFFTKEEILWFNQGFEILEVKEAYEEPCSLILIFSKLSDI